MDYIPREHRRKWPYVQMRPVDMSRSVYETQETKRTIQTLQRKHRLLESQKHTEKHRTAEIASATYVQLSGRTHAILPLGRPTVGDGVCTTKRGY